MGLNIFSILLFFFSSSLQFEVPFKLKAQIYQYPLNFKLYRNLLEVEKPSSILAVPIVSVDIGTPTSSYNLIYSTGTTASLTLNDNCVTTLQNPFLNTQSSTCDKEDGSYESNSYTYGGLTSVFNDYINFSDNSAGRIKMKFFNYFHYSPNTLISDGELGMSKRYKSLYTDPYITKEVEQFSIIEQLYANNIIDKRVFAHQYKNDKEGTVFIGEEPKGDLIKYTCKGTQSKGEPSNYWNCPISTFKIDNKEIQIDYNTNIAMFSTGERFIFVPEESQGIIEYIKSYSTWGKEHCTLDVHVAYQELHCDYKGFKYSYFPTISFTFEEYEIELKPEDVFYYNYNNKYYRLLLVIYNMKKYWIIGSPVLKGHNMIFNVDEDTVTFFTEKKSKVGLIAAVLILLLIIGGIVAWFIRRNNKKKAFAVNDFYKL